MASVFGHGIVAYTLANVLDKEQAKLLTVLAIVSSIIPDLDVIGFFAGIPYDAPFGHRGFTHSILFALLWSILLSVLFGKNRKLIYFTVLLLATISHGILDAMTSGGEGVGFFIPFDNERYFFDFRPILVSPIGVKRFFSEWGFRVIKSEFLWVLLPCLIICLLFYVIKYYQLNAKKNTQKR